jgi:hypothetical protein
MRIMFGILILVALMLAPSVGHVEVSTMLGCTLPATHAIRVPLRYWRLDGKPSGSAVIFGRSPGPPNSSVTFSSGATCKITHVSKEDRRMALIRLEADWSCQVWRY